MKAQWKFSFLKWDATKSTPMIFCEETLNRQAFNRSPSNEWEPNKRLDIAYLRSNKYFPLKDTEFLYRITYFFLRLNNQRHRTDQIWSSNNSNIINPGLFAKTLYNPVQLALRWKYLSRSRRNSENRRNLAPSCLQNRESPSLRNMHHSSEKITSSMFTQCDRETCTRFFLRFWTMVISCSLMIISIITFLNWIP